MLVWAADANEQALVAGTTLAGELPVTDDSTARFGVFLNDGTGSKMSYYIKPDVQLSWGQCSQTSRNEPRQLALTLTLTNDAPLDAQTSLPPYITGTGCTASRRIRIRDQQHLPAARVATRFCVRLGAERLTEGNIEGRRCSLRVQSHPAVIADRHARCSINVERDRGRSNRDSDCGRIAQSRRDAACGNAPAATLE